jgi:hypothetical protein
MKQETKPNEFVVFNADVKKMSDAELEASLKELRELSMRMKPDEHPQTFFRRRAA